MHSIEEAQKDMNTAYYYGVPGIISSGSVWLISGLVALLYTPKVGMATLIFGGTLIFPISVLLCKLIGRNGKHQQGNPLAPLAIEGTLCMLLSIPVAVGAALYKIELFFPAMLLIIAGRYLTFNTIYGSRIFWVFGSCLVICAFLLLLANAPVYIGGIVGGLTEYLFAMVIFITSKRSREPLIK